MIATPAVLDTISNLASNCIYSLEHHPLYIDTDYVASAYRRKEKEEENLII
jgi:hypothetical protein